MLKLLVQLSDTHIRERGALAYGRVDTATFLSRAVEAINKLPQPASAVVVTGDLTDFGSPAEYEHLRQLLSPIQCPLYLLCGNHDVRANLRAAFPDHTYLNQCADVPFMQYVVDLGGVRLVVADTTVPNGSHGEFCENRERNLRELLDEDRSTPAILALHHPPFQTYIGHMDRIGLLCGASRLAQVVSDHPQIERVICGHLHRNIQVRWAGTVAVTAPSTAHQVCLDLSSHAPAEFTFEPAAFLIHVWSGSGPLVTHLAFSPGPTDRYPFHDDQGTIIR